MNKLKSLLCVLFLSSTVLSCSSKEGKPTYQSKPALRISPIEVFSTRGTFLIETVNASGASILCLDEGANTPSTREILDKGIHTEDGEYSVSGLEAERNYVLYGVAYDTKGRNGNVCTLKFNTITGPEKLYDWEKARTDKPRYSNLALCYGGSAHRSPYLWDEQRFDRHVTYTDEDGKGHFLFDAFLAIEFVDTKNNMAYMLGNGRPSADKKSWTELMDYWFDDVNGFAALDRSVGKAIRSIGSPATKRKVIITIPDPIIYQNFKDETSSTTYWGFIDGRQMDFRKADDRITAMKWYIDEVRERWSRANYSNLEFIGFYIISEDLAIPGYGWSAELKHWEDIYPAISNYIHSCNETLTWIPYNSAGGHQLWKNFGIDYAMMQPNYFWHSEYDMNSYMAMVLSDGLSMEFEFDQAILEKNSDSYGYRARFYEYMSMCKKMGLYGKRELSYYFGTNDFYDLSLSTYPKDKQLYHDLCKFIIDSIH